MHALKHYIARAIRYAHTPFEALIFFGSLRDGYSGRYLHEGWIQVGSPEEIHAELRKTHEWLFHSILRVPLPDLGKQLRIHFQSVNQPERETSAWWLEFEPFRDLIPQGCSAVLRELFISQVRTALEVLYHAPEWSELAVPAASLHQPPDLLPLLQWLN